MTTFVILAAGRGTRVGRVGENLHKALLPLDGQAVLSHLLDLAPPGADVVVVLGDRGAQIRDYVTLAHPSRHIEFIVDSSPAGPGSSLLTAREWVTANGGDLVFTSCDTLWKWDDDLWKGDESWVGVAPVPAGTQPERWCRFETDDHDRVQLVLDKCPGGSGRSPAYVGLARISAADLPVFWAGVADATRIDNEYQVSSGFETMLDVRDDAPDDWLPLVAKRVHWTDVGDEAGYRRAVAEATGYDWTKTDQATYVLEDEERVVKYAANRDMITRRVRRAAQLGPVVPELIMQRHEFLAYRYVPGETAYAACELHGTFVTQGLLDWFTENMWHRRMHPRQVDAMRAALRFYKDKTAERVAMLPTTHLRRQAASAVARIGYLRLCRDVLPGTWHGDLNHGNVIVDLSGSIRAIDWREDFAGETGWGDLRYDVAKLLAGTYVHWDNARRGDFRPWDQGPRHAVVIRDWIAEHAPDQARSIEIIGALSLINSAPLHAEPLDEILVARGVAWLEEVL